MPEPRLFASDYAECDLQSRLRQTPNSSERFLRTGKENIKTVRTSFYR